MKAYYLKTIKFESEDLLTEADEYIPEYTDHFSATSTFGDGLDVELVEIVDEVDNRVPIHKFHSSTISKLYEDVVFDESDRLIPEHED